jgi:hypothetical protein
MQNSMKSAENDIRLSFERMLAREDTTTEEDIEDVSGE